jgi:hypothetical protein
VQDIPVICLRYGNYFQDVYTLTIGVNVAFAIIADGDYWGCISTFRRVIQALNLLLSTPRHDLRNLNTPCARNQQEEPL